MKKLAVIIGFIFCLSACGSSEAVQEARKTIDGDWTLTSVNSPGNNASVAIRLLKDASAGCFTSSSWVFVSNNNTGSYNLEGDGCEDSTRFFRWSVEESPQAEGQFDLLLKPTDSDYRSNSGNEGFRFDLVNVTQTEMVWEQTVTFEGEPFIVRMNFNKN